MFITRQRCHFTSDFVQGGQGGRQVLWKVVVVDVVSRKISRHFLVGLFHVQR
jgi:hypothetical protein